MERVISLYMDECASKQLREKTMQSYEKTLKLFTVWLKENEKMWRILKTELFGATFLIYKRAGNILSAQIRQQKTSIIRNDGAIIIRKSAILPSTTI